jgi:hypothetical protein
LIDIFKAPGYAAEPCSLIIRRRPPLRLPIFECFPVSRAESFSLLVCPRALGAPFFVMRAWHPPRMSRREPFCGACAVIKTLLCMARHADVGCVRGWRRDNLVPMQPPPYCYSAVTRGLASNGDFFILPLDGDWQAEELDGARASRGSSHNFPVKCHGVWSVVWVLGCPGGFA